MKTRMIETIAERDALTRLGQTIRLARLRRNLSQADFAGLMGVSRSSLRALEIGEAGVSVGLLLKAVTVLGYTGRLADLLSSDPIGDGIDEIEGRRRAGRRMDVVDF